MKTKIFVSAATLVAQVYGAACPYELLKRSGLLSEADAEKFEAVKRDPSYAETLFAEHQVNSKSIEQRDLPDLPLDLPFGGGLREFCYIGLGFLLLKTASEWRPATAYRSLGWNRHSNSSASRFGEDSW